MTRYYTASKSRSQGRDSWAVIFRHPTRVDATGKAGRRIRRGLGTTSDLDADRLVGQLNELLASPEMWEPSARALAVDRFDERVVEIFYEGSEASTLDFPTVRNRLLPLPTAEDGYRKVLLLGTTGAGKTTVVRQILGTDPATERFPSTSTAKTTVADTELILTDSGSFRAAITFVSREEVVDYLTENVSDAALAVLNNKGDGEVFRRLLDHVNQRYRFSYVLGRPSVGDQNDDDIVDDEEVEDDEDLTEDATESVDDDFGDVDLEVTQQTLHAAVTALRTVVGRIAAESREMLNPTDDDERLLDELIEENLDNELRQTEEFHEIVDMLIDEIEQRFSTLQVGSLTRNRQAWPVSWTWDTDDRARFIRNVSRFSSNYAPLFGRLLTPLVNGIRVMGPFSPAWSPDAKRLVLVDGEGLGHTPTSAASLSTHVARQLDEVDAILLVDNAKQPMQAAPVAALRGIAVSGNGAKLHYLFTHFDQVTGDNLPTFKDREEHVLASVENVLKAIGEDLGSSAERVLRQRLDAARFFVGGIQTPLDPKKKSGHRAIAQLDALLDTLDAKTIRVDAGPSRPVFDRMNLSLAITEAARSFHSKWRGILGLEFNTASPKEHWTRVKALSRRLAEGWGDEYDNLKPVADLRFELQRQVYLMLQRPVRWEGGEPSDDVRQQIIDDVSNAITRGLFEVTKQRVADDVRLAWQQAYLQKGAGSTTVRARIIANEVFDRGAPVPTVVASPDQNRFLQAVAQVFSDVVEELDIVLE